MMSIIMNGEQYGIIVCSCGSKVKQKEKVTPYAPMFQNRGTFSYTHDSEDDDDDDASLESAFSTPCLYWWPVGLRDQLI